MVRLRIHLVGGIVGMAGETSLGEDVGVFCGGLLLDGSPGVADDGGAGAILGVRCWVVEVGSELEVAGEEGNVVGCRHGASCVIHQSILKCAEFEVKTLLLTFRTCW